MSHIKNLEHLCVVHADFNLWSGQCRLTSADLKLGEGGEIPPETVAHLGTKKICDPANLRGFGRLKTKCRRYLLSHGMPFMNGVAIPASKMDMVSAELDKIGQEFNQERQKFLVQYDHAVAEWIAENKEYGEAIRQGAMPRYEVAKRINFDYQIFVIQPVSEDDPTATRLDRKVEGLGTDLLEEVVNEANRFFDNNLRGRVECGANTQLTLKKIRDKVDGLSFLNGNLYPLVELLDTTIRGYSGNVDGRVIRAPFFYQVVAAVLIMGSHQRIKEYANGVVTLDGMTDSVTPEPAADQDHTSPTETNTGHSEVSTDDDTQGNTAQDETVTVDDTEGATAQDEVATDDDTQGSPAQDEVTSQTDEAMSEDDIDADLDQFFGALDATSQDAAETEAAPAAQDEAGSQESVEERTDATNPAHAEYVEPADVSQDNAEYADPADVSQEEPEYAEQEYADTQEEPEYMEQDFADAMTAEHADTDEQAPVNMPEIDEEEDFFF